MKLTKPQMVGAIILGIAFLMIFLCRISCNKRAVEKEIIKHEVKKELEKKKEHIIEKVKPYRPIYELPRPTPYIRPYNVKPNIRPYDNK